MGGARVELAFSLPLAPRSRAGVVSCLPDLFPLAANRFADTSLVRHYPRHLRCGTPVSHGDLG